MAFFGPLSHTRGSLLLSPGMISLGISDMVLLSGIQPSDCSFGGASHRLLITTFSLILGVFQIYQKDCLAISSNYLGSLPPDFCSSCIETKKVFKDYSLLSDGISSVAVVFSCSVRRRGKNIRNKRIC